MSNGSTWSASKGVLSACLFSYLASLGACGSDVAEPAAQEQIMAEPASSMAAAPRTTGAAEAAPSESKGTSTAPAGASGAPEATPTSASRGQSAMTAGSAAAADGPAAAAADSDAAAAGAAAEAPIETSSPGDGDPSNGDMSPDAMGMAAAGSGAEAPTTSSGPAAGMDGSMAAAGASGGEGAAPHEDLGKGDGSDVITIGDSWMSNTLGTGDAIQGAMQRLTMQPYRHYAVQGVMLMSASAFGAAIPTQYDTAKRINPDIKTVLMTGGGNDIIQNPAIQASCDEGGQECVDLLNRISDTLNELWTKMADDGVQDVVYVRYSKDAGSTSDKVRGMQKPVEICTSGRIRCHSIDSTEAVMAQLQDGIHPTRAANDRLAKVIWEVMESEGVRR